MFRKPFTSENCPIQVGMIIYNPETDSDLLVLERFRSGTGPNDPLIRTCSETFSGNDLMNKNIRYYTDGVQSETKLACIPGKQYIKVTGCALMINDTLDLCAETFIDTDTKEKEVFVRNLVDNKRCKVAVLQYPGGCCLDYGSVVLIEEDTNNIMCKIDNTEWLHYMLGDLDENEVIDCSDYATDYVHNILAEIAKYWR